MKRKCLCINSKDTLFFENIKMLLFQEKALITDQMLQIFDKVMPSPSYCWDVLCHFYRDRLWYPFL